MTSLGPGFRTPWPLPEAGFGATGAGAMCAVAFWFWMRNRFLGALVMAAGFVVSFAANIAKTHIPTAYASGSGQQTSDPAKLEPAYVTTHAILDGAAVVGLVAALGGFILLSVEINNRASAK